MKLTNQKPEELIFEETVNQQKEFTLLNQERKQKGHTLFEYNKVTGEIKKAEFFDSETFDMYQGNVSNVVTNPNCFYRQALNKKNLIKRLKREGIM